MWLGFAAFIGLGLPEATLGVTWPSIRAELDRPLSSVGWLLGAITVGYLPSSAMSGRVVARLGAGRMLAVATGLYVAGLSLYLVGPAFWVLVVGSACSGVAAGMIDPGLNAHFAIHHGTRAMNLLHASFGIGATLGPLVATVVLQLGGSWRIPYAVYAALQIGLLAGFVLTRDHWSVRSEPPSEPTDDIASEPPSGPAERPSHRLATGLSIVEFFVYTGLEVGTGVLAYTLLTEERGVSEGAAGLWTTAYWASLTVGRALLGVVGGRTSPRRVLRVGTCLVVVATTFFALDPGGAGAVGLPVLGLALSGIFPSMVLLTPERVGTDRTAGVVGVQFSVAAIGASGVPAAISWLADDDLERIGPCLVALALVLAALDVAASHVSSGAATARRGGG